MSDAIAENKVTVKIFGEEYPITGSGDPAHITRVAEFVDTMMKEVARVSRSKAKDKVAILTALTLASELLEMRDQLKDLKDDLCLRPIFHQVEQRSKRTSSWRSWPTVYT